MARRGSEQNFRVPGTPRVAVPRFARRWRRGHGPSGERTELQGAWPPEGRGAVVCRALAPWTWLVGGANRTSGCLAPRGSRCPALHGVGAVDMARRGSEPNFRVPGPLRVAVPSFAGRWRRGHGSSGERTELQGAWHPEGRGAPLCTALAPWT